MEQYNYFQLLGLIDSIEFSVVKKIVDDEWNRFADVGKIMADGLNSILHYSPDTTIQDFVKIIKRRLRNRLNPIVIDAINPKLDFIFKKIDDWANSREPNVTSLYECMLIGDDQKPILLDKLHTLIDGKKGKDVALVILVCMECNLMTRPQHKTLTSVFGDIGSKQGYNDYYNRGLGYYKKDEINHVLMQLNNFLIVDN